MQPHEAREFEEELVNWVRSERANRHDFVFRPLTSFPRYEYDQRFPSCQIPCYHFGTGAGTPSVHRTVAKERDHIPYLLNTLFDLSITQSHNQSIIYDSLIRLSQYSTTSPVRLQTIPEGEPYQESSAPALSEIQAQLTSLKADLREVRSAQTYLKAGFNQLRESVQEILSRESEPKPIEAATAEVADQLRRQLIQVQALLEETKKITKSLVPE